jgi:hypothetical protein
MTPSVHDEGRIRVRPDVSQVQALLAAIGKVVPADLQHALVSVDVEPGRDHMGASFAIGGGRAGSGPYQRPSPYGLSQERTTDIVTGSGQCRGRAGRTYAFGLT